MNATPPKKRIAIVDAGRDPAIVKAILPFFADRFNFEYTSAREADYVFHSCNGYQVLKCPGVRIFITGENVSPNFNISDYALAFDPIVFGDRYLRFPLFRLYTDAYAALCAPRPPAEEVFAQKSGFCAYVMSNTKNSAPERTEVFEALFAYKPIACGGKWRNNVGGPVDDKIAFQSKYKFVLAVENSSTPGYLTEKFAQAAQSNAVPIYWGDPTIGEHFNPRAFVNCHEFDSFEAVAERVAQIDTDDELYKQMLSEPWFPGGKEPANLRQQTIANFLANIFDQPYDQAFRRNRSRWGMKYEKHLREMAFKPHLRTFQLLSNRLRGR